MVFEGLFARARHADDTAAADPQAAETLTRPTIGLALGGGAARGFAHIGVMHALAAHGIVPDVIVGTSIGAVVGGCFAAQQLDTLEQWARSLNVRSVMKYLDINLSGSGLISGNHLAKNLEAGLRDTRIDELPTRFAAIATEFNTGHEIWLTRGRMVEALRASYALPGIFPPVKIGGRWLVDGALVNPVPVSAARALGARLVIAVNLNSDLFGRGTIIASVPNFGHWYPRSRSAAGLFDYDQRGILDASHLRFFTRRSFLRLARRSGLEPLGHRHTGLPFDALHVATDRNVGRVASVVDRALVRAWPTMFAYQFVYELAVSPALDVANDAAG